jgi:hypothetical protein
MKNNGGPEHRTAVEKGGGDEDHDPEPGSGAATGAGSLLMRIIPRSERFVKRT